MTQAVLRTSPLSLADAARALAPVLARRACTAEIDRRLSSETMTDLFASRLLQYYVPARFGGLEMDWGAQITVGRYLAHTCGSTSWIGGVVGSHALYIARMSPQAQEDVWGNGPDVLVSTGSVMRNVTVDRKDGGYVLSGRWSFCSGVDHASWVLLRASPEGAHEQSYFLIPKSDLTIDDDWFVSAMSGSGSKSVILKDAFVPDYRILSMSGMMAANPPGAQIHSHYLYAGNFRPFSGSNLMGPILGAAESVLYEFQRLAEDSASGMNPQEVQWQLLFAEAAAEIGAAERLIDNMIEVQTRYGSVGQPLPKLERINLVRDRTFAARLCLNGSSRLMAALDASNVRSDAPIQRMYRDLTGMLQQIGVNWDRNMISCAKATLDFLTEVPELNAD
ncbi:hypothetical protein [Brevundimonas vesicularis]|uniref:hypothetical protein n=1 Tax=Brevundimonas vesicularis TaxID=41276 RepID=UPI0038D4DCA6